MRNHRFPWFLAVLFIVAVVFTGVGDSRTAYERGFIDGQLLATQGDTGGPDARIVTLYRMPSRSLGIRPLGGSLGWILLVLGLVIVATRGMRWHGWTRWAHEGRPAYERREWRRHVREMHKRWHPWFSEPESDEPFDKGPEGEAEASQEG